MDERNNSSHNYKRHYLWYHYHHIDVAYKTDGGAG